MPKNKLLLHIGAMPDAGTPAELAVELDAHRDLLAAAGLHLLDTDPEDVDAATVEMLRRHRDVGLERRDVEGSWAELTRHLWRGQRDALLSIPGFADADLGQAALILDHLGGLEVHVAISGTADVRDDIAQRWSRLIPGVRLHHIDLDEDAVVIDLAESLAGIGHLMQAAPSRPVSRHRPRRRAFEAAFRIPA